MGLLAGSEYENPAILTFQLLASWELCSAGEREELLNTAHKQPPLLLNLGSCAHKTKQSVQ